MFRLSWSVALRCKGLGAEAALLGEFRSPALEAALPPAPPCRGFCGFVLLARRCWRARCGASARDEGWEAEEAGHQPPAQATPGRGPPAHPTPPRQPRPPHLRMAGPCRGRPPAPPPPRLRPRTPQMPLPTHGPLSPQQHSSSRTCTIREIPSLFKIVKSATGQLAEKLGVR